MDDILKQLKLQQFSSYFTFLKILRIKIEMEAILKKK